MARLGGEFAVLMLITIPEEHVEGLDSSFEGLSSRGYRIATTPTERPIPEVHPGWSLFRIEVEGADHEGIIHRVARHLSKQGISIEAMETETTSAPFGGIPLFNMSARVAVPPDLADPNWEAGLGEVGNQMNLEIRVQPDQGE